MRLLGCLYGKRFGLKIAQANRMEWRQGGVCPSVRVEKQAVEGIDPQVVASSMCVREKRLFVRARNGSHGMVEIKLLCFRWLSSFWSTGGSCPPQSDSLLAQSAFPSLPLSEWLRLFSSRTFSHINTPAVSSRLFFLLTPPMKTEQTAFRMSAHKIRMPGNHPKERTFRTW